MKNSMLVFIVAFAFCTTAVASDIAISTQAGWMGQGHADNEAQEIVNNVTGINIEVFTPTDHAALATWVQDHTGNGTVDLLVMFGIFPSTIYPAGNAQPDGSIAEAFLDDGNCIINTGDYIFYVGSAGNNDEPGLENMMDIGHIAMWGDDTFATMFTPTDDGQLYTPSLTTLPSNRPWFPSQLANDWEVELVLAQTSDGTQVHPAIMRNTVTDGRLGVFFQCSQDTDTQARGEVISEWINNYFKVFIAVGNPLARRPDPRDGALYAQTWVNLTWRPGDYAVSHDVYIGDNFGDVDSGAANTFVGNTGQASQIVGFVGFPFPDGLVPGTTYYWRVDEVNDDNAASPWKGNVWSFWVPPKKAYNANPADDVGFVLTNATLNWATGFGGKLSHVYFGKDAAEVEAGTGTTYKGPVVAATYDPGPLEEGTTYYWRIDQFDGTETHKGDVWSLTTVPNVAVSDPSLLGWWTLDEGEGTTAVDWSGHGNHGSFVGDIQWADGYQGMALEFAGGSAGSPTYVNFGNTESLQLTGSITMSAWVKMSPGNAGVYMGIGGKLVSGTYKGYALVRHSSNVFRLWCDDGAGVLAGHEASSDVAYTDTEWHHLAGVVNQTTSSLYVDGVKQAQQGVVNLTESGVYAYIGKQYGDNSSHRYWNGLIDDVRIYSKALTDAEIADVMLGDTKQAGDPTPDRDALLDIRDISSLSWSRGAGASSHDVYLGADRGAVAVADNAAPEFQGNQAGTSLSLAGLVEFGGGDYYWRIDEVEAGGAVNAGTIWKFTVPDYLIVDNFESYNNIDPPNEGSNRVFDNWVDGYGTTTNGALVGNDAPPYGEHGIVKSGNQSLVYAYDNAGKTSEATLTVAKRDWTVEGVTKLSLWLRGASANAPDKIYVALNGTAVIYHDDPAATQITGWNGWVIDLAAFGVGLNDVSSITIGIGTKNAPSAAGGTGTMYFDEITLIQ